MSIEVLQRFVERCNTTVPANTRVISIVFKILVFSSKLHTSMTLTTTQITALIEKQNLGNIRTWYRIPADDDNQIYVVNNEIIVRLNALEPTNYKFRKEALIYQRLRTTDLPVPQVLGLDTSHHIVPYDVILLERLSGERGLHVWPLIDGETRKQLSHSLGAALASVHNQRFLHYGGYNEESKKLGNHDNWRSYLLDKAAESLIALWQCEGLPAMMLYGVEDFLMRAVVPARPTPSLVHGDFGLHNALFSRGKKGWHLSGLLDFEWALVGDPEYEFATGLLVEPDEVNPIVVPFLQGYRTTRDLPNGWEQRTYIYRLIYHLSLCAVVWKHYGGDPAMLRYHRGVISDILKTGK